jgi:hypothetical protein
VPPADPLARLAAALDPVMRAARTQGERVAVMRAAWAAARVVLAEPVGVSDSPVTPSPDVAGRRPSRAG